MTATPSPETPRAAVRREWHAERGGWAAMAAMLLASTLGVFGSGPLAPAEARGPDGLAVRYERFSRVAFLEAVELRGVSPPPR